MANKERGFEMEEIAAQVGTDNVDGLKRALYAVVRCPFTQCQSFDTFLSEKTEIAGYEIHHCHRCDRNFHVQREAGGYSILGWYGE